MSTNLKALLAIIAASLLWCTAGLSKPFVKAFDPFAAAFLRFLIATIALLPFYWKQKNKFGIFKELAPITVLSAINVALYYIGIQTSTANAAVVIYAGVPLVTGLLAYKLIGEPITRNKVFGIIIGMIGVITIVALPLLQHDGGTTGSFSGNILFLIAVVIWSCYTIGSRHLLEKKKYSPLNIVSVSVFTSCLLFFILTLFTWKPVYLSRLIEPKNILLIFHSAFVVTITALLIFQWAIKHSSATTASLKQYLEPIFAVLFNIVFLDEKLTTSFIMGSLLIFIGIITVSLQGLRRFDFVKRRPY